MMRIARVAAPGVANHVTQLCVVHIAGLLDILLFYERQIFPVGTLCVFQEPFLEIIHHIGRKRIAHADIFFFFVHDNRGKSIVLGLMLFESGVVVLLQELFLGFEMILRVIQKLVEQFEDFRFFGMLGNGAADIVDNAAQLFVLFVDLLYTEFVFRHPRDELHVAPHAFWFNARIVVHGIIYAKPRNRHAWR